MRLRILETATTMFLEEGFENTSLRKIAKRIEYSPAAIYLYFKDKGELLHAIHERGFSMFLQKLSQSARIANPLERLEAMGHLYIEFASEQPEYYDLMFIMRRPESAVEEDQGWDSGKRSFQHLKDTVAECIEAGLVHLPDAEVGSLYIWSFMHGMTALSIRNRMTMYPDKAGHRRLMEQAMGQMMANVTRQPPR
ncbi:MAG: TetR/AcrR family transcriptional regulator [bacterium]|nr:TetR/AcrR family transcriptional regulator [bacterium]